MVPGFVMTTLVMTHSVVCPVLARLVVPAVGVVPGLVGASLVVATVGVVSRLVGPVVLGLVVLGVVPRLVMPAVGRVLPSMIPLVPDLV